jgi:hypothetical protein
MSLAINIDRVTAVLLPEVGWVQVGWDREGKEQFSTFDLDAYEYRNVGEDFTYSQDDKSPSIGFHFVDSDGHVIMGPITSILAIQTAKSKT